MVKIEIEDKKGVPWITFTADDIDDWKKIEKVRDNIFNFESDDCYAQYQVPMNFNQANRQFSIMLDIYDMDEDIENIKDEQETAEIQECKDRSTRYYKALRRIMRTTNGRTDFDTLMNIAETRKIAREAIRSK